MEGTYPVITKVFGLNPLMLDLVLMTILLTRVCIDNLRAIKLGSCGKDVLEHFLRVLGESETVEGTADDPT